MEYRCAGDCQRPNTEVKNPTFCENCDRAFHPKCTSFQRVRSFGKVVLACKLCVLKLKDSSENSGDKTNSPSLRPTPTTPILPANSAVDGNAANLLDFTDTACSLAPQNTADRFDIILQRLTQIDTRLQQLDQLPELITRVNDHERRLLTMEETQHTQSKLIENLASSSSSFETKTDTKMQSLITENSNLKAQINDLAAEKNKMSSHLISIAALTKLNEVIITGLSHTTTTDLTKLVCCTANALNIALDPADVINVHRSGRKKEALNPAVDSSNSLPPATINLSDLTVKLRSTDLVNKLVEAKRRARRLHTTQLDATLLSSAAAPSPQISCLININEKLPAPLYQLLMSTKHKARSLGYSHAWYGDGCIKVKQTDTSSILYIRSEEDLQKIVPRIADQQNFRAS